MQNERHSPLWLPVWVWASLVMWGYIFKGVIALITMLQFWAAVGIAIVLILGVLAIAFLVDVWSRW